MIRDFDRLTGRTFDLLVVGGGIYGLAIAYDAAQRGLATALVERRDFGSGASFNHLRTIHGGLRYLQTFDVRRARESVNERRTLARIAPHLVRPMRFVLPLVASLGTGKAAMRAGFVLDRLIAFDRNRGLPPPLRLPAGQVLSRKKSIEQFPVLRHGQSTGAAVWYDYVTIEADRLTFSFALAADEHGAVLVNHVEATALLSERGRVCGARVRDAFTGRDTDATAKLTVNATGAACDRLLAPLGLSTATPLLKAMNLITSREAGKDAFGGRARSGRHLFLIPWHERMVLGTWESTWPVHADAAGEVSNSEVEAFIAEANQAFPSLDLREAEATLVHRGVVPAVTVAPGRVKLEGRSRIHDHARDGVEGLLSVIGVKYTTARAVAETAVDLAVGKLGAAPMPCRTARMLLAGGHAPDSACATTDAGAGDDSSFSGDALSHLAAAYGSRSPQVASLARENPAWRHPVSNGSAVMGAELVWAARHEMAMTLSDVVIRRTSLGAVGDPGDAAVERAAAIVGRELRWSDARRRSEIAEVHRFYARGPAA
jgi:glycerol-3-phosphate dehydrogenase